MSLPDRCQWTLGADDKWTSCIHLDLWNIKNSCLNNLHKIFNFQKKYVGSKIIQLVFKINLNSEIYFLIINIPIFQASVPKHYNTQHFVTNNNLIPYHTPQGKHTISHRIFTFHLLSGHNRGSCRSQIIGGGQLMAGRVQASGVLMMVWQRSGSVGGRQRVRHGRPCAQRRENKSIRKQERWTTCVGLGKQLDWMCQTWCVTYRRWRCCGNK